MREEISAAVLFLVRLIEKSENFNKEQLEDFKLRLSELLVERFENHWFPDKPFKGQGYRCIRVNERDRRDATLEQAARACGIKYEDMKLPVELTLWVDPNEVCCRFGENKGSYCTLASFSDKENRLVKKEPGSTEDMSSASSEGEEPTPTGKLRSKTAAEKKPVSPLSPRNARQGGGNNNNNNNTKKSSGGGNNKQKQNHNNNNNGSMRRPNNMAGSGGHLGGSQSWTQSWYASLMTPHWMGGHQGGPLPPPHPLHPAAMMRNRPLPPPHPLHPAAMPPRYANWPKAPLKV
ncbi:maternal B9.15 protein isoform X2 [Nilaparvata lugens]|uniref:maternal B9.15 protein isoform X2 n=1 Tax=Nilaparvata lugens TaxID=108931 RepID=UPI00193DF579|nr:maternal B9.15 protein isoform X2 [Nilaparvata lugens]